MEYLNTQLQPFFEWLLRTTVQASLLICVILLLQRILRNRLCIRWHYGLWLLLLVRMSLPWAPQSRASMFNLIPRPAHHQQAEYEQKENGQQSVGSDVAGSGVVESVPVSPATTTQESPEAVTVTPSINPAVQNPPTPDFSRIVNILPLLWLTGSLVLAVYVCAGNFNLWRIVKRRRPLTDQKILELLEDCKTQMGIQTILGIVPTDKVESPALFGFVRPRLLLPEGMIETLSQQELRYILLHELAHLKRHDIYIGWLMSLLQVLHWFNPLVWLAFYRMRSDRELACDALVLARTQNEEPKSYGRIIVSLVERFSRPQRLPGMAGILETKAHLKRRITMIARFKKNSYQWSPLAVILIIILGCVSLPDAKRTKASEIQDAKPAPHIVLRRLWSDSYAGPMGAPSPDGKHFSYVDWETGDLAVYETSTGKTRRVTDNGTWDESQGSAYSSRWSPDSKQIVYCWFFREQDKGSMDLRILGLNESEPSVLCNTPWARLYDWSPDGKQILVCLSGEDGENKIALVSVADGSIRTLKKAGGFPDWPKEMDFSPDGKHIVYSYPQKEGSKKHNISVMSIEGSRDVPLVEHPADDFVLGWAPDGKNILFGSDRAGTLGIWLTATADGRSTGDPRLIKENMGQFESLGLTEEGAYYYSTSKTNDDVYVATLDRNTGTIISPPDKAIKRYEGSNMVAAYSPEGKRLAYIYHNSRDYTLCIRSLETGQEQEYPLNLGDVLRHSSPRWSPDGRSILFVADDKDDISGIYEMDVHTGEIEYLVRSHTCAWSADGKAVLYVRLDRKDKTSQIISRDLETGKENVLAQSPLNMFVHTMALSPDGQWLALRGSGPTSLKIMSASGGEARELPEFEKVASIHKPITWTADSQYILFSGNEPGGGKHPLYQISRESGKTEKLGLKMTRYYGLSAHPDGRRILVSCEESAAEQEFWVIENFLPVSEGNER